MATRSQRSLKQVLGIHGTTDAHWVGDGFPVRTLFSYQDFGRERSPFLLPDYAGPRKFPPTNERLGVGPHPHRGFETVTIVYEGEVEHRDSSGGGGKMAPPRYQSIVSDQIPTVSLADGQGAVRVIAGVFAGTRGTARLAVPDGHTTALLLCGEPIDEPIVGHGPFVMNSPQEIRQAILDYQSGKMGRLA